MAEPSPKRRILLVEDEALIALAGSRMLADRGYEVQVAGSGEAAVEAVAANPAGFDVVLMDIDLGRGIDGTEAARRILAIVDLPLIFLSSHLEREIVDRTESITSFGYVTKSAGITVLDASIHMAVRLFETRAALRESERGYRLLFENLQSGFALHQMLYDADGKAADYRFLEINQAFERMTGLKASEVRGHTVKELLPGIERYWIDTYAAVAAGAEPARFTNYSAEVGKHFEVCAFSPEPGRFATIIEDATERTRAAERLNEALDRYQHLFETTTHGVVYQDGEGLIVAANPAAERMLGLTRDQMVGRSSRDPRWTTVHPDGSPWPGEEHPSMVALRTGCEERAEPIGVFNPALGTHVWLNVYARPIFRAGEERPYQVYTTLEDVTERKRTLDALKASEERFSLTMDAINDGVWDWHVHSGDTYFSPVFYALLGYTPEQLPPSFDSWRSLLHPDESAITVAALTEAIRESLPICLDYRLRCASGRWRWFRARGRVVESEAGIGATRMVGTLSDIHEAKTMDIIHKVMSTSGWDRPGANFFGAVADSLAEALELAAVRLLRFDSGAVTLLAKNSSSGASCCCSEDECCCRASERLKETTCGTPRGWSLAEGSFLSRLICGRCICVTSGAAVIYGEDPCVRRCSPEGLAGISLCDMRGKPIGAIVVCSKTALPEPGLCQAALKLVAVRASGELERLNAMRTLQTLVEQKSMLMRELQHRVKNNLAVVSSLLQLQAGRSKEAATRESLRGAQTRVRAMALIYERLMVSDDPSRVDLGRYASEVARIACEAYQLEPGRVAFAARADEGILVDSRRASHVALIVNELVTNALKYAFPGERHGSVSVSLTREGPQVCLRVEDDGVGMAAPPDAVSLEECPGGDASPPRGLGLNLVEMLAGDLHGAIRLDASDGMRAELSFPYDADGTEG